jgi:hypothetical protein
VIDALSILGLGALVSAVVAMAVARVIGEAS